MYRSWTPNATADYPGAIAPPPGVVASLQNHTDARRIVVIVTVIVCAAVSTLFFITRIYVKAHITRKILPEDVACSISWLVLLLFLTASTVMYHYGEGYHAWNLSVEDFSGYLKWLYAISLVYSPAAFFIKTTLLLIIARVFAVRERVARGVYAFIIAMFVAYLPIQFIKIFICIPIRAYWDPHVEGKCLNQHKLFLADICLAIFTDMFILLLPIPLTWSMRIDLTKKIKIIALLGIGGIGTAVAIYRLVVVIPFVNAIDVSWDFVILHWTSIIELTIGFICSCFPAVNILVEHLTKLSKTSPNAPRTRRKQDSKITASWLGSGLSEDTSGIAATLSTAGSSVLKSQIGSTDPERSRLSNHPVEMGGTEINEEDVELEHWNGHRNSSLTSSVGRREGWLSSFQVLRKPSMHGRILKTVEISMERSRRYSNRQWDAIWDGGKDYSRRDSLPGTGV
ncbi:integral membrane protein [Paramyrothecium foliicola]|nr:integral membrane protein [Paramyrothecium foliicola]